jgi:hypothetical protein
LVRAYGWQRSYALLGVGQHPIARILAGQRVLRTTLVAVRTALSAVEAQAQPREATRDAMIDEAIRGFIETAVHAEGDRIIAAVTTAIRQAQPARLLSVADAAAELGISQCSVRRHVADGSLPSRKVGARVLVDMSAREAR